MENKSIDIKEIYKYFDTVTAKARGIALQFVDDNFMSQGYRDNTYVPWRRTSTKQNRFAQKSQGILIKTGRLRRSPRTRNLNNRSFIMTVDVPYAKAHNEGFSGTVTVSEHTREKNALVMIQSIKSKKSKKVKTTIGTINVKSHTRNMNIPRRQFMPSAQRGSAILDKQFESMINKEFNKINFIK